MGAHETGLMKRARTGGGFRSTAPQRMGPMIGPGERDVQLSERWVAVDQVFADAVGFSTQQSDGILPAEAAYLTISFR